MINTFEPLLCFARYPTQTPDEVFDMLQERMMTMLGYAYAEKGISFLNWTPDSPVSYSEMDAISYWHSTPMTLSTEDFDRLGKSVDLSMADVLGTPKVEPYMHKAIAKSLDVPDDSGSLDPVVSLITLAVFDRFNEIARQRQQVHQEIASCPSF